MTARALLAAVVLIGCVTLGHAQQPARDAAPPPPLSGAGVIAGVVTAAETPQPPIGHAQMLIIGMDSGYIKIIETDDRGRFAFQQLPAGKYVIGATKSPFVDGSYGVRRPGHPGTAITVVDGQHVSNLAIRMTMGAAVTGTVRDARGQPVPNAAVRVIPLAWRTQAAPMGTGVDSDNGRTDDRGVYRLFGLQPGDYLVAASPQPGFTGDIQALSAQDIQSGLKDVQDVNRGLAPLPPFIGPPGSTGVGRVATPGPGTPPAPSSKSNPTPTVTFVPMYFPGSSDIAGASTVSLKAGEVKDGVDILTRLVPTSRVEGFAYMPDGQSPTSIQISLALAGGAPAALTSAVIGTMPPPVRAQSDGSFTLRGVPPGHYNVLARSQTMGSPGPGGGGPAGAVPSAPAGAAAGIPLWASTEITVFGMDIGGLGLTLQPGLELSGKVVIDRATSRPSPPVNSFRVSAGPAQAQSVLFGRGGAAGNSGRPGDDGAFSIGGLIPGLYAITASGMSGSVDFSQSLGWTVQSVVIGGRDVTDSLVDLQPNADLKSCIITIGDRHQTLNGTLSDAAGHPAPDYTVILFSTENKYWFAGSRRIQITRPATDGAYEISGTSGLPPGTYYLAALDDLGMNEQYDPGLLTELAKTALKVTITPGERKKQNIRIRSSDFTRRAMEGHGEFRFFPRELQADLQNAETVKKIQSSMALHGPPSEIGRHEGSEPFTRGVR